ncbi:MAG: hypothetical protein JSS51_08750 [Planctomycetes bacterium]|nr:hypothetical protein [Planctomycetota bacterium]
MSVSSESGERARCVILLHTLPDGSAHLDWMIESDRRLLTFRLPVNTEVGKPGRFEAVAIADHRLAYLDFEGPVSGGRGDVKRLSRYILRQLDRTEELIRVELEPEAGPGRGIVWTGRRSNGDRWHFVGAVC